jgi:elongation factor G
VRQVLEAGVIAGYPVQDVRVIVYDGKHHSVDSKDIAFITAGRKAFIDAVKKARPIVLEPIVKVEITAPEHQHGRHHRRPVVTPRPGQRHAALIGGGMVGERPGAAVRAGGYQAR